jgi:predicted AlkP superfamily pyrophosphatase or phosphodiesterase
MIVKNNYNECLTNLACSIRKYFGLDYKHNTLKYIDELLDEKKPKNVVCILLDGMGSNIIDKVLESDSFFIKNRKSVLTSVFPATTTAATTSIRTGLNPCEHGWLGWNTYIKPINKTITLFNNCEYNSDEICEEFLNVKNLLVTKTIVNEINEKGEYSAIELFPFGENYYVGLDDMLSRIENECSLEGKKYIYAYDDNPDHAMHEFGCYSESAISLIKERNFKIEELCNKLEDSIIFVIADHGHLDSEYLFLDDYPELVNMLEREASLEQRTVSFKIKDGLHDDFVKLFNEIFGSHFTLYNKQEIIDIKLFGDGEENVLFRDALGDFVAINEKDNICLGYHDGVHFASNHAGYLDDEIFIPLIVVDKCK